MEVWHHVGSSTAGKGREPKPRPGLRGAVGSNVSAWGDTGLPPTKQTPGMTHTDDYSPSAVDAWATECGVLSDDGEGKNKKARVTVASPEVSGVIGATGGAKQARQPPGSPHVSATRVGHVKPHVTANIACAYVAR